MKRIYALLFFCISIYLYGQTTIVNFNAKSEIPVFIIERTYIEASKTLTSSINTSFSSMKLLGMAPFRNEFENGVYSINIGGYEEYNKTFVLKADGKEKNVNIYGDVEKAKEANYWAVGMGLVFTISLQSMPYSMSILPDKWQVLGVVLPVVCGSSFIYNFLKWIFERPRVEVKNVG
jgi:hypothetical protein